jgi:hypothetical protein
MEGRGVSAVSLAGLSDCSIFQQTLLKITLIHRYLPEINNQEYMPRCKTWIICPKYSIITLLLINYQGINQSCLEVRTLVSCSGSSFFEIRQWDRLRRLIFLRFSSVLPLKCSSNALKLTTITYHSLLNWPHIFRLLLHQYESFGLRNATPYLRRTTTLYWDYSSMSMFSINFNYELDSGFHRFKSLAGNIFLSDFWALNYASQNIINS